MGTYKKIPKIEKVIMHFTNGDLNPMCNVVWEEDIQDESTSENISRKSKISVMDFENVKALIEKRAGMEINISGHLELEKK